MKLFKKNDFFYANGITSEEKAFYFPKQEKIILPPNPDATLSDKFWDWLFNLLNPNFLRPEGVCFPLALQQKIRAEEKNLAYSALYQAGI